MSSASPTIRPSLPRVAPALTLELDGTYVAVCLRCERVLPGRHPQRSDALEALHGHGVLSHELGAAQHASHDLSGWDA